MRTKTSQLNDWHSSYADRYILGGTDVGLLPIKLKSFSWETVAMPAKDIYHDTVKNALVKDGWTITDDPLKLTIGSRSLYVDLGAEKLIAAQKDNQKIAVEIKSFLSPSPINDLENALGQYVLYQNILKSTDVERILYLAVREEVYNDLFAEPIGQLLLSNQQIKLITFSENRQELVKWID